MDVDDDDDNAEEPQNVPDYGIVVNFEELDDEQREVSLALLSFTCLQ